MRAKIRSISVGPERKDCEEDSAVRRPPWSILGRTEPKVGTEASVWRSSTVCSLVKVKSAETRQVALETELSLRGPTPSGG